MQVRRDSGVTGQARVQLRQSSQTCSRAIGLTDGDGPIETGHRAVGDLHQFVVPLDDLYPVGLFYRAGIGVQRGDGGLGLELTQTIAGKGPLEHPNTLGDHMGVPQPAVLFGKGHESAVGIGPCRASCMVEQHECEQTQDLLVVGPARQLAGESDRLGGKVDVTGVALVEDQVEHA